jgi:hypothetical protein
MLKKIIKQIPKFLSNINGFVINSEMPINKRTIKGLAKSNIRDILLNNKIFLSFLLFQAFFRINAIVRTDIANTIQANKTIILLSLKF